MIFEVLVSTINLNGEINFAPFGIQRRGEFIYISPYIPSQTLENLSRSKCAVINYLNDANFFVDCLIGNKKFKKEKCTKISGYFLKDSISHDELIVKSSKKDKIRPTFKCKIVFSKTHKKYEGFNRSQFSIIEGCILATRVKFLSKKKIFKDLEYLSIAVEKTGGLEEKKSWQRIKKFINNEFKKK